MRDDVRTDGAGVNDADAERLRAAYRAETDRLIRSRLDLTVVLFLLLVGIAVLLERSYHPERGRTIVLVYLVETVSCAVALTAVRVARLRARPLHVATILTCILAALVTGYLALVGGQVERLATAEVCLLSGLIALLPWGWRSQLLVSATTMLAFAAAIPRLGALESVSYAALALLTGGTTSVFGAFLLDRYRFDAFVRTALLRETQQRTEEEAEIAAALFHVGQELSAHVGGPDVLEHVNRLTVEVLGADYSATYIWDARQRGFRLHAGVGASAEVHAEALEVLLTPESLPAVGALRPGDVIEVAEASGQGALQEALMQRWHVASALAAPICRGQDVSGVLIASWRDRTGPFTPRARRLVLGIAHAVAIALENARLIADLQAANKLKTEFVSTMSHELRTPLNVILGYADMAQDERLPEGEWRTCLQRIDAAGRELLELIEDTLEIGRIEAGRDEVRLETVSLGTLWDDLGRVCARMPRRPGVELEWKAASGAAIVTDSRKLTVVVRNLVSNAVKFTEEGRVACDAVVQPSGLVVRVADTGIGIPAVEQTAIFEMFRQIDGSDRRRYGGTGLGLYIARRFVQQLGGTIALESAPGAGSVFTVALPLRQSQPPARRAA